VGTQAAHSRFMQNTKVVDTMVNPRASRIALVLVAFGLLGFLLALCGSS
jgi:hypothetical protein